MLSNHWPGEPTLSAQIKVVPTLRLSLPELLKPEPDRRKRKRGMFSVPVQIRGGVGTLEVFEDLVTSLGMLRDGVLLSTSRGGYSVGQKLHVSCPYWCAPTAINVPRNAQVVRNVLLPNYTYALALQFMPGICEESSWSNSPSPYPNQVRVLCVESDSTTSFALRAILEKDGYHVVAVSTAKEALDISLQRGSRRNSRRSRVPRPGDLREGSLRDCENLPALAAHSRDSAHRLRDALGLRHQSRKSAPSFACPFPAGPNVFAAPYIWLRRRPRSARCTVRAST